MPAPMYALFDRALPITPTAAAMVGAPSAPHAMSIAEKLGAALITELGRMGNADDRAAATSHVRAAVMLTRNVPCDRADP